VHFVADPTKAVNVFQKNKMNRHDDQFLSGRSEDKSQNTSTLHRQGEHLLMLEAIAGDTTWKNLATLGLETTKKINILEVNVKNLVFAKATILLPNDFAPAARFLCSHGKSLSFIQSCIKIDWHRLFALSPLQ